MTRSTSLARILVPLFFLVLFSLTSFSLAARVEIGQKHVFPGEEVMLKFYEQGPADYYANLSLVDWKTRFHVYAGNGETFEKSLVLFAPSKPGNYTLFYPGGKLNLVVEKPVLQIQDFGLDGEIKHNSTVFLHYKLMTGDVYSVFNLTSRVEILPDDMGYSYEKTSYLAQVLNPSQTIEGRIPIRIGKDAKDATLVFQVNYVFDGEEHEIHLEKKIVFPKQTILPWLIVLAIALVLAYFLRRRKARKRAKGMAERGD